MTIESMYEHDRGAVHDLLRASGLPLDGFDAQHVYTLVARSDGRIVGSAALEIYGRYALLRSVAVDAAMRGNGLGQRLTNAALGVARQRGLDAVYLLTETAVAFFPRFGFTAVARDAVPADVRQSVEFTTACPASAQVMMLELRG